MKGLKTKNIVAPPVPYSGRVHCLFQCVVTLDVQHRRLLSSKTLKPGP